MDINLEDIHISQYLYVLVKRIWLIILCFVLIFTFTIYLTYRQVPIYEAKATMFVSPMYNPMQGMSFAEDFNSQILSLQTHIHIIKSDPIANMIVDALNLEKRFASSLSKQERKLTGRDDIVMYLKESLTVTPVKGTRIVEVSADGTNPELIADIVNTACEQFIIYNLEGHMQSMRKMLQWHTEQLEDLKNKVKKSKEALIDFIEEEKVTLFDGGVNVVSNDIDSRNPLAELRVQLMEYKLQRDQLLQKYTLQHPKVKSMQDKIEMIEARMREEEGKITNNNKLYIKFEILRNEADADQQYYNIFLRKFKEINIADSITSSNVQVMEYAAVPKEPVSPNKVRNYLMGILFGVLGGIGMAFVVEYFDDAPKSAAEIEAYLNLPIVATIPKLKRSKDRSIDLISAKHPKSTEAEVMRMLRTCILFEKENPEDKIILITSAGPKEGKSSIASNLAVSMAHANIRTLIMDADLRRPIMHRLFNLEKEVGLSDLLLGRATLDKVIKKTDIKNLYVMTCGTKVPNPAELLNSQNMKKLFLKLRNIFGQIVIDSPPTGNLADSLVLSSQADSTILVYSGELNKNLLLQTKRMLEKTNIKIYGIVLNNFNTSMKGYYYSYYNKYYNRYYQTYFHEESEEEQELG